MYRHILKQIMVAVYIVHGMISRFLLFWPDVFYDSGRQNSSRTVYTCIAEIDTLEFLLQRYR
jgi:hypothetical protein